MSWKMSKMVFLLTQITTYVHCLHPLVSLSNLYLPILQPMTSNARTRPYNYTIQNFEGYTTSLDRKTPYWAVHKAFFGHLIYLHAFIQIRSETFDYLDKCLISRPKHWLSKQTQSIHDAINRLRLNWSTNGCTGQHWASQWDGACVGSLRVLRLPTAVQRHAR